MGDTLDLVGLACVLTARNGASGKMTARICAESSEFLPSRMIPYSILESFKIIFNFGTKLA